MAGQNYDQPPRAAKGLTAGLSGTVVCPRSRLCFSIACLEFFSIQLSRRNHREKKKVHELHEFFQEGGAGTGFSEQLNYFSS
jgi:hypothetical protein